MWQLKPYTCTMCGMYLHCFDRRKQHVKRHKLKYMLTWTSTYTKEKPYKCEICLKAFSHQEHLKRHIGTHTKEKPYQCEYCQKCFLQRPNLNAHIRTHTKEKPYQCEYCQKCFFTFVCPEPSHPDSHQRETVPVWDLSEMFFTVVSLEESHPDSHQRETIPVWDLSEMFFTTV